MEKTILMKDNSPKCRCLTCGRPLTFYSIGPHRAAHKRRGQDCVIRYTNGDTKEFKFSDALTSPRPAITF